MPESDANFLSRWSRRKAEARTGAEPRPEEAAPASPAVESLAPAAQPADPTAPPPPAPTPAATSAAPLRPAAPPAAAPVQPPPTLADVAGLTSESDYTRFVSADVAPDVKNAALKKLFSDPHFNVMDGLDIYIDDYGKPDPLPPGMLRQMVQSKLLGLFDDPPEPAAATAPQPLAPPAPAPVPDPPDTPDTLAGEDPAPHEDADLQLQPDDAAGRTGPGPGAEPEPGREH